MQDSMRRVLIDRLLSDKSVVTLQELQDVLKVSIPTIKRDLRYMRKELKAPIVYSRTRGGYLYDLPAGKSGASPEFQRFWFSAQELYVVVKMVDMLKALSKDKSSVILQDLEPLRSRVAGLLNLGGKSPREILGRVKVIDPVGDSWRARDLPDDRERPVRAQARADFLLQPHPQGGVLS